MIATTNNKVFNFEQANATICQGFTLAAGDQFWIFDIAGVGDWSIVHHIGLYGCDAVPEKPW